MTQQIVIIYSGHIEGDAYIVHNKANYSNPDKSKRHLINPFVLDYSVQFKSNKFEHKLWSIE